MESLASWYEVGSRGALGLLLTGQRHQEQDRVSVSPQALGIEVCAEIQFINRWTLFSLFPGFNFQKQNVSVMAEILLVLGNPP